MFKRVVMNCMCCVYEFIYRKEYNFFSVHVLREDGSECETGEVGRLVAKLPLPPGFASTLWLSDERFKKTYFKSYPVRNYLKIISTLKTIPLYMH